MRKKCVRWTKSVRTDLAAAAAIVCALVATPLAQSNDPATLPRLAFENIMYVGGFRLPNTMSNGDSFSIGGKQLAFNPAGPSLFVGSRAGRVAEISIPTPVNSANPEALPFSSFIQPLTDPTEGRLSQVGSEGVSLEGLLVYNNRLYGTASVYYDANNIQRVSHYSRSLHLNQASFSGWSSVWRADRTGFVSGLLAHVPAQWQGVLGGPAISGQCCIPIVTRTSWGPAAFSFDPSNIGSSGTVPASPLLYYTGEHPTLGQWDASSPVYGSSTTMGGMVIIPGTRTALYFGANGTGPNCYGDGTADPRLAGTRAPDGSTYCYDPTNNAKGSHAYPYRYQIWAYDLNDFAAVRAGTKQPWDVVPYGVWPFDLPTQEPNVRLGGVAYDPATQQIYLSQLFADKDGFGYRALIHALYINMPGLTTTSPATSVAISADMASPQPPGTSIRFAASPTGGRAPFEYRWHLSDGSSTTALTGWQASNEHAWTPAAGNSNYRIGVHVRSGGNRSETPEAASELNFPIASARASAVALSSNQPSPQPAGTAITWTATPTGGHAPHQYQWWIFDGAWTQAGSWTTSNTFTWTPATAGSNYRVAVWVRSNGNTSDHETATEAYYTVTAATAPAPAPTAPPAPTPTVATPVSAVVLSADRVSPQPANTTITWTAMATGGGTLIEYQWWVFDGANWSPQPWSSSNRFSWTPATAGSSYRVAVWARRAGASAQEASTEAWFTITAPVAPSGPVTAVRITSNLPAPQRANTTIVWTATPTGGASPVQYQWWVFDGANWISQPWTTGNTFTWRPTQANASYRVAVWARSAGNTNGHESSTEAWFAITP